MKDSGQDFKSLNQHQKISNSLKILDPTHNKNTGDKLVEN
jgi:hypothetical protein